MADRFDIQRMWDQASNAAVDMVAEFRGELGSSRFDPDKLVKLSNGYFFDPTRKFVLKKVGSQYLFVRHDRRKGGRKSQAQAEAAQMRMIQGGFFWDDEAKKLYIKQGASYVLYSPDRRKASGKNPHGAERRKRA